MMKLGFETLGGLKETDQLLLPTAEQLNYPEKVLQFGTGVLLRGLPDQYIYEANRKGIFRGRVVVAKSTSNGSTDAYDTQNSLYTLALKGIKDGKLVNENHVNASISRVVSATADWDEIIALAKSPDLQVVISNTTEVGIVFVEESIHLPHPSSFPAKLLAVLHERFKHFQGDQNKGLVILPTELIEGNGTKLHHVLNQLATHNNLDQDFIQWMNTCNPICNTLVDRIVPGKLSSENQQELQTQLGYQDDLMIMAEPYALWAIESSSPKVKNTLTFCDKTAGAFIAPSIEKYKEIKLRLLNATHTFSCGVSLLAGKALVKDAMTDNTILSFVKHIAQQEIAQTVSGEKIAEAEADAFASAVIDRFSNPFLEHKWHSISAQFTLKMKSRCLPLFHQSIAKGLGIQKHMLIGLSAYIVCMKTEKNEQGTYDMLLPNGRYTLTDDLASKLYAHWQSENINEAVKNILSDQTIWGEDLTSIATLETSVAQLVEKIIVHGINSVL